MKSANHEKRTSPSGEMVLLNFIILLLLGFKSTTPSAFDSRTSTESSMWSYGCPNGLSVNIMTITFGFESISPLIFSPNPYLPDPANR